MTVNTNTLTAYINNIDAAFPRKGQDNPSSVFRDNFTAIKNSLATSGEILVGLETNKINKGTTSTSRESNANDYSNNLIGAEIRNVQLSDWTQRTKVHGIISGTQYLKWSDGPIHTLQPWNTGTVTVRIGGTTSTDFMPADQYAAMRVYITVVNTASSVTWGNFADITNASRLAKFTSGVMRFDVPGTYGVEVTSLTGDKFELHDLDYRQLNPAVQDLSFLGYYNQLTNLPGDATTSSKGLVQI